MAIAKDAELNVVEFEGKEVESVGLIKMDFLGLTYAVDHQGRRGERPGGARRGRSAIDDFPIMDDARDLRGLCRAADTAGTVPVRVPGHAEVPARTCSPRPFRGPDRHERPLPSGPDGVHPGFHRPQARAAARSTYDIADMEKYLSDTYGITVYQEQVMLLSQSAGRVHGRRVRHAAQGHG